MDANKMKTALENALAELRNQHREMIAMSDSAPHGCPCVCGDELETCPTLAVIEECERALADEAE